MSSQSRPVVYLHMGAPKTGTSYVQDLMWRNREALRRDGFLVPGASKPSQFLASLDLRRSVDSHRPPASAGAWARLVDEVRAWGGTALIDEERLCRASVSEIDQAMSDLDFAEVHLVYTVRDIARVLPAQWQERVKHREGTSWTDFLADVRRLPQERTALARLFWDSHDMPEVLARWSRGFAPERVHVVTVPPPGGDPDLLWRRVAGLYGLEPEKYDLERGRSNASLGAAEVQVLRRLNLALPGGDMSWPAYRTTVKTRVAEDLARRRGSRIELPEDVYEWACEWARRATKDVADAGYQVVGDLDELLPSARPTGENPDLVSEGEQVDVALAAMQSLLAGWQETREQLAEAEARAARAQRALKRSRATGGAGGGPPGKPGTVVPARAGWRGLARRGYRRLRGVVRSGR
jgi:hypothetical protein